MCLQHMRTTLVTWPCWLSCLFSGCSSQTAARQQPERTCANTTRTPCAQRCPTTQGQGPGLAASQTSSTQYLSAVHGSNSLVSVALEFAAAAAHQCQSGFSNPRPGLQVPDDPDGFQMGSRRFIILVVVGNITLVPDGNQTNPDTSDTCFYVIHMCFSVGSVFGSRRVPENIHPGSRRVSERL